MAPERVARKILPPIVLDAMKSMKRELAYRRYMARGGIPFGMGYGIYRKQFITNTLSSSSLMARFVAGEPLPPGYGVGLDERCVEYPWMIGQLEATPGRLLDAGSTLNYDFLLDIPTLQAKVIHIMTLAPEEHCFWQRSISYIFDDLRDIPVRDNYYDTISCLSTLEHVGCDNSTFTGDDSDREHRPDDYVVAIEELCRVLRPGGTLLVTVPFGVYSHLGVQQQFDARMLARAIQALTKCGEVIERYYRYSTGGWNLATAVDCIDARYVEWAASVWAHGKVPDPIPIEPDQAVAARAVACLRLNKRMVAHV